MGFGATNIYTNENCRIRWTFVHEKRKEGIAVKYYSSASSGDDQQSSGAEETDSRRPVSIETPKQLLEVKNFNNILEKKADRTFADLEKDLWKNNVT